METHNEDYYWLTGEVEDEAEFLQDLADDGLFEVPKKKEVSQMESALAKLRKEREWRCDGEENEHCDTDYAKSCFLRSKVDGVCLHHFMTRLYPRAYWGVFPSDGFSFCRLDIIGCPPCIEATTPGKTYWRANKYREEFLTFCHKELSGGEENFMKNFAVSEKGHLFVLATTDGCRMTPMCRILEFLGCHQPFSNKVGYALGRVIERYYPWEFFTLWEKHVGHKLELTKEELIARLNKLDEPF